MMDEKWYPQRKSPRLQGYDYTQQGAYFVTICTYQRQHLFGDIENGRVRLNRIGDEVEQCWQTIPEHFPEVELDAFVVMPNHMHGIIVIRELDDHLSERTAYMPSLQDIPQPLKQHSLGVIISNYKSAVSRQVNRQYGLLAERLWQERYHDHIIRNEKELASIREYVMNNPALWEADTFYSSL